METARSRFLRYVTYYTTSDEHTGASPSTERQKDLGRVLLAELTALGLTGARMDSAGNVIATLPASEGVTAPVLALIAHMDTSPDAPGENVQPRVVRYEGGDLPLSDTVSLTESLCPGLSAHAGEELIVTDGTTLLGADDKAGIAEIMAAVELLEGMGAKVDVAQNGQLALEAFQAVADGKVAIAQNMYFAGNTVYLDHGQGVVSSYAHMSRLDVKPGEMVKAGQQIGLVGATGRVTGPHLHLEIILDGVRVDPMPSFPQLAA